MKRDFRINYNGVEMDVTGYYTPYDPGNYETPPDGPYYEIETISIGGVLVFNDKLSIMDDHLEGIELQCIELEQNLEKIPA